MILLLATMAYGADCATASTDNTLRDETTAAVAGLESGDSQRFADGMNRLASQLGCVGEIAKINTMAQVRMLRGVQAFGAGDLDRAAAEFLAARALDAGAMLPVYPENHAIYGVFRRLDPVRAKREKLPPPRRGTLFVDGYETRDRYLQAPSLVQLLDGDNLYTQELEPGEMPHYAVRHPIRNRLMITSSLLVTSGAALLLASAGPHSRFNAAQGGSLSELGKLRSTTNLLAGGGLAVLGGALGVGALTVVYRAR